MQDQPVAFVTRDPSSLAFIKPAFPKHRFCAGAVDALLALEENPVHLLITDASLEDMTGIELAEAIKEVDEERGHYTYVIMIVDGPVEDEVLAAHESSIHAVVRRADLELMLLPMAIAGMRFTVRLNAALKSNKFLVDRCADLEKGQLLDPDTGLGNRRYAEQSLNDTIRQIESRGGAVCFLLVGVGNFRQVIEMYDDQIGRELVLAIAQRIQSLVRPLDVVTYFSPGQFALILNQPTIDQCSAECYQRIYEGVKLKSYKTSIGFMQADIAMSICASEAHSGPPNPGTIMQIAEQNLPEGFHQDRIIVHHLGESLDG